MRVLRICVSITACLVIVASVLLMVLAVDRNIAPEIVCSVDRLEVSVAVTDEELLGYVTATDSEDGDLTEAIVLERGSYFRSPGESWVTYAVCDSGNKVTRLEKKIVFTDYAAPRIDLKSDLIFRSGKTENLTEFVTATDLFDGNISRRLKLISTEFTYLAGTYTVNIKVSNSMGDTRDLTVDAIVTDDNYQDAKIRLRQYILYNEIGTTPNFAEYINNVSSETYSEKDVVINDSAYKADKEGVYNIFYTITDGDETVTMTRLIVVNEG